MENIIIAGLPGSGKGTQAKKLANQYPDMTHLESGDLLREAKKEDTELGEKIRQHLEKGELVPNEYVNNIVSRFIDEKVKNTFGFIFDGYPRTEEQARFLDGHLNGYNTEIHHLLYLEVSEEELIKRIQGRGREDDQDPEVVRNRINVQRRNLDPILLYYKSQDKLINIDGEHDIDSVFKTILVKISAPA